MIKIMIYREPLQITQRSRERRARRNNPQSVESSLVRTKTTIKDLCLCNKFDWFCTFTYDPKRSDVRNLKEVQRRMLFWLEHQKRFNAEYMQYLAIPERHKSGAIHFHVLLRNYPEELLHDSGKLIHGRKCYNISRWHWGFSTAVKIDNIEAVAHYVSKYITKDMIVMPNKKRYFCSRYLERPIKIQNSSNVLSILQRFPADFTPKEDYELYEIWKKDVDNIQELMLNLA